MLTEDETTTTSVPDCAVVVSWAGIAVAGRPLNERSCKPSTEHIGTRRLRSLLELRRCGLSSTKQAGSSHLLSLLERQRCGLVIAEQVST